MFVHLLAFGDQIKNKQSMQSMGYAEIRSLSFFVWSGDLGQLLWREGYRIFQNLASVRDFIQNKKNVIPQ